VRVNFVPNLVGGLFENGRSCWTALCSAITGNCFGANRRKASASATFASADERPGPDLPDPANVHHQSGFRHRNEM
jgi:hypothetical protein